MGAVCVSLTELWCHFLFPCRLLDPANTLQFDDFKKCYGEILYRWGLREKKADVLKFASCPPEPHKGIGAFLRQLSDVFNVRRCSSTARELN